VVGGHELAVVGIDLGGFKVRADDRPTAPRTAPGPRLGSFGFGARQRSGLERLTLHPPLEPVMNFWTLTTLHVLRSGDTHQRERITASGSTARAS
jgi:hypothetical protein